MRPIVIARSGTPTAFTDFAAKFVPVLQQRGASHRDYETTTLRECLMLDYPINQLR